MNFFRSIAVAAWKQRKEIERDTKFVELGRYLCEVRAGQYWRLENLKCFDEFLERRSGIEEESVLPDLDPRTLATASEERAEGSGMGEGDRVGQAREAGQAELRLCNGRQMPKEDFKDFKKAVEKELTGPGNRALADSLRIPEPLGCRLFGEVDQRSPAALVN